MAGWDWLNKTEQPYNPRFVIRVIVKALILFVLLNVVYAVVQPLSTFDEITVYNTLIDGRERFPYADNPTEAYNISLDRLTAMFASHIVSDSANNDDEFRVFFIGDSSVWGWLLNTDETFNACLNNGNHFTEDGRRLQTYNLGYPVTNALKALMIIDYSLQYEPDAIVWLTTLEGLYDRDLLTNSVIVNNSDRVVELINRFDISLDSDLLEQEITFLDETIVGQRREIAELIRHQFYGVVWASSEFDHTDPHFFRAPMENLPDSEGIPGRGYIEIGNLDPDLISLDAISAGMTVASESDVPILLVNEPIFISNGINSDLRYNYLYPRWAYDSYREMLTEQVELNSWRFVDLWDYVPAQNFTDFLPLHYDAEYTCNVANELLPSILDMAN